MATQNISVPAQHFTGVASTCENNEPIRSSNWQRLLIDAVSKPGKISQAYTAFHSYSIGNALEALWQCTVRGIEAGPINTFVGWKQLGRHVRRGEKGIVILAPMVGKKRADAEEMDEDATTRLFGFRAAHVFDLSQTDGEPMPELTTITGDPKDYTERLERFVMDRNIALDYDAGIAPAKGLSSGGKITLLPDLPPAEHFAVLVHETAHELLHRSDRRTKTTKT
jgi:antirestriction protein ArdC